MAKRIIAAAAILAAGLTGASAASGNGSLLALQSKAVKSGGSLRVIVEFAPPALPVPSSAVAGPEDAAWGAALRVTQNDIVGKAIAVPSAASVRSFSYSPMVALNATASDLKRLASDGRVVAIHEDTLARPTLNKSVRLIGMFGSGGAYAKGAEGRGMAVAVLDTGVDKNHEFLAGKVVSEACFSTNNSTYNSESLCPGNASSSTASGSGMDCDTSIAGCGHGTHVAGIAAGQNTSFSSGEPKHGVARKAGIVAIQVFSEFDNFSVCGASNPCALSFTSDQMAALERVFALRGGVGGRKIAAVNMSLGGGSNADFCSSPLEPIIKKLRNAGIATVIAAGNDGNVDLVASPGCIKAAITVGASTKKSSGNPERMASYTNMGIPVDVLAPGGDFTYPLNDGTDPILSSTGGSYDHFSGTSMAAPHVAGAIAALKSRSACRNESVVDIEQAMRTTGLRIVDHRSGGSFAKRRLNMKALMAKLGCN